ncbi:MAG: hypothetical protein GC154_15930 [bacterium]|nr:hypothetical protein [bacterium]
MAHQIASQPLTHQEPMPPTLVFGSVGDRGQAVASWFGSNSDECNHERDIALIRQYKVAIIYYGSDPESSWAQHLRINADYFDIHSGGKFQNLLRWIDQNPGVVDLFEYIVIADDDIVMSPEKISRMVRTMKEYDLPVASAAHSPEGKISWPHMGARGFGRRTHEPPAGVELCNFVEMTCPIIAAQALRPFLELFRRYAPRLTGWGTDWLISCACFSERRPFGVMHNVTIVNPYTRPGSSPNTREIDLLEPTRSRERNWLDIAASNSLPSSRPKYLKRWLPKPRLRVIQYEEAKGPHGRSNLDWIDCLGFKKKTFCAFNQRDMETRRLMLKRDVTAAVQHIDCRISQREIVRFLSQVFVMQEEIEFCGPEGVFIMEGELRPIPPVDACEIVHRIDGIMATYPETEAIVCHKPYSHNTAYHSDHDMMSNLGSSWNSTIMWYNHAGLRGIIDLMIHRGDPIDLIWRVLMAMGKLAMLDPAMAWSEHSSEHSSSTNKGSRTRPPSRHRPRLRCR